MTRPNSLLPWIRVGLLAASAAAIAAIGLMEAPAFAQPAAVTFTNKTPGSAAPSLVPAATGAARSAPVAGVVRAPLPAGQVWQCVIDGERIFSDAPCGEHASIRKLSELNVMDAPPARGYVYAPPYAPSSAPVPTFAPLPADDPDYAGYEGPEVFWVRGHAYPRHDYSPRQDNHIHPQPRSHPHPGRN